MNKNTSGTCIVSTDISGRSTWSYKETERTIFIEILKASNGKKNWKLLIKIATVVVTLCFAVSILTFYSLCGPVVEETVVARIVDAAGDTVENEEQTFCLLAETWRL